MHKGLSHYISLWLGSVMIIVVVVLAAMLIFTNMWNDRMVGTKRWFMVALLLAYAVYRGFRLYAMYRTRNRLQ
jgi:hypothetical protein